MTIAATVPLPDFLRFNRGKRCRAYCGKCELVWSDTKTTAVHVVQPSEPGAKQLFLCDACKPT